MLASPEYRNELRLKPDKAYWILYFLTFPDAPCREKDGADAVTKQQAQHWTLLDDRLCIKADRSHSIRRHVAADEVFDILTAEHLRHDHAGRDEMLKMLESRYIGYTKAEVMYVIANCSTCGPASGPGR